MQRIMTNRRAITISGLLSLALHSLIFVSLPAHENTTSQNVGKVVYYGEIYSEIPQMKVLYTQQKTKKSKAQPVLNEHGLVKSEKQKTETISQHVDLSMSGLQKSAHAYGQQTPLAKYATLIRGLIAQNQYYPTIAKKLQQQGRVQVYFEIVYPNKIQNIKIHQESSYETLNTSALSAVEALVDLPPIPEELKTKKLTLVVPIDFKLI
ncbi:MAG: TonB family protein [Bacteriovoracaceae bacterium]|nr:TonB family protein [Bacteriovoracaceae bacterium]